LDYKHKAGFLTVYITEAHTQDEWPMGDDVLVDCQPTEIRERCQLASEFQDNTHYMMPIVVDTMMNHFDSLFGAWPVRFFIIQNNILMFKANPNSRHTYDLQEVRSWLSAN